MIYIGLNVVFIKLLELFQRMQLVAAIPRKKNYTFGQGEAIIKLQN